MKLTRIVPVLVLIFCSSGGIPAQDLATYRPDQGRVIDHLPSVLDQRSRVEPVNRNLRDRLENVLPGLMREVGMDMWVVINREYVEDPVYLSLVPEPVFAARRTTILVIFDRGEEGVERLTVSRYGLGGLYDSAWDGGSDDEQFDQLAKVIRERDPKRIGINKSRDWAFGDGITASLYERLTMALGSDLAKRVVSAEDLAIRWLETRTAMEVATYSHVVAIARSVVDEAFSDKVITPGVTTTEDVAWFIRQRYADLDLPVWFMPYVNVQRAGTEYDLENPFFGAEDTVIERGDVLHTDVGVCYFRMCTDTQEMGYVLKAGETGVPDGLARALLVGNRWQDHLTSSFVTGRTGNEILARTIAASESEGIVSATYTHPIGYYGHAAGPTVGMWDNQGPTPVRGDWKLHPNTAYAIEGNVKVRVPEWNGQWVQIKMEQSALFNGEKVIYLAGRQTEWHIVE